MCMKNLIKILIENELLNEEQFSFNKFKSLNNINSQLDYASLTLPLINDKGGGRRVFDFGNNKVLKIAKTFKGFANGIEQNLNELKLYEKLNSINIVPVIYDFDSNGNWIVSEKVDTPFEHTNKNEIYNLTDLYWDEMEIIFSDLMSPNGPYTPDQLLHSENYPELSNEIEEQTDFGSDWRLNENIIKLFKAVEIGIGPEEILVPEHFGINSNGQLVIVDYGF